MSLLKPTIDSYTKAKNYKTLNAAWNKKGSILYNSEKMIFEILGSHRIDAL